MPGITDAAARQPIFRSIWPVFLAAPVMLTGIQVILPALPAIQTELELSDAQVGLITSVYLLPTIIAALVAGILADRYGRRQIMTAALVVFGLGGIILTMDPHSFGRMLAVRGVQGAASAMVLALTITIIGDAVAGSRQVTGQGYRSVAMKIGDGTWPIVGGLLVGLAWWAPFTVQSLSILVAFLAWFGLAHLPEHHKVRRKGRIKELRRLLRSLSVVVLQMSGFLRFFLKLALITYLPVLAVSEGVASVAAIGLVLGAAAIASTSSAPAAGWLARRQPASRLIAIALALMASSLGVMALYPTLLGITAAAIIFGLADGVYGTLIAATTTRVVSDDTRATFVGLSAAIRNFGKFAAPTLIGILVLSMSLRSAFGLISLLAFMAVLTAVPLRRFDHVVRDLSPRAGVAVEP